VFATPAGADAAIATQATCQRSLALHIYGQWLLLGTVGAATRLLDINIQ